MSWIDKVNEDEARALFAKVTKPVFDEEAPYDVAIVALTNAIAGLIALLMENSREEDISRTVSQVQDYLARRVQDFRTGHAEFDARGEPTH